MSWKRLGGEEVGQNSVKKINYFTVTKGRACLLNNLNVLISVENNDLNFKINLIILPDAFVR